MTSAGLRLSAVAAVVAPCLLLASTIAYIVNGDGLSSGEWPGAIQIWAFIAFGVAIVGVARLFESTAPRTAATTTVLGIIGVAGGAAYGLDSIQVAFLHSTTELGESDVAPLALRVPGIAFPLALLVLGVMLTRHRQGPPVAGYAVAVGAVLFPPARIADIAGLAVASDVFLLFGMSAIGVTLLSKRTETCAPEVLDDARPTQLRS